MQINFISQLHAETSSMNKEEQGKIVESRKCVISIDITEDFCGSWG